MEYFIVKQILLDSSTGIEKRIDACECEGGKVESWIIISS